MTRECTVTKKRPMSGNNVSHANNKTKRRFLPNLHNLSFQSDILNQTISLRVSSAALRTIEKNGGLDAYLLSQPDRKLDGELLKLKKQIVARSETA